MNKIAKFSLIVGAILSPFIVGALATVVSMVLAFRALRDNGITDPKSLAAHIGNALIDTSIGVAGSLVLFFAFIFCLAVRLLIKATSK